MEQKQTAVEWLVEKLKSQGLLIGEPKNLVAVQQAKEMEKQQIVYAHLLGLIRSLDIPASEQAEQYYNEEYGK